MATVEYKTTSGTTYYVDNRGSSGTYVSIVAADGKEVYKGLSTILGGGPVIYYPGVTQAIDIAPTRTIIILPGASVKFNTAFTQLVPVAELHVWVGGRLDYSPGTGLFSNTVFHVTGGELTATPGSVTNTLSTLTVDLSDGGKFTQSNAGVSVLSNVIVNFGDGGGTYIANSGATAIDTSRRSIKNFKEEKDIIEFTGMASPAETYSIKNVSTWLGIVKNQDITLYDSTGNAISTTRVEGRQFKAGKYEVNGVGPLTINSEDGTIRMAAKLSAATCFLPGTLIRTPSGERPVEDIKSGDEVFTYKNGQELKRSVVWVGHSHAFSNESKPDDISNYPVRILKDAISDGVPYKDLLITAEHCLSFDGKFIPARMLVNGRSIFYDKSITSYDYYHIEMEEHAVIVADGIFTESYLDTGNRRSFRETGKVVSFPVSRNLTWNDAALPLDVSREFAEPLFNDIMLRAEQAGLPLQEKEKELVYESDMCLLTDTGLILKRVRENNGHVIFMVPDGVKAVRIVSSSSRPSDIVGPFVDDRRYFGVAVGKIVISEGGKVREIRDHFINADLDGWLTKEWEDTRWTSGNAILSLGERSQGNVALLSIEVKASGPYLASDLLRAETVKNNVA